MSPPLAVGCSRLPAGRWTSDPARSRVGFTVQHLGTARTASFQAFDVRLDVPGEGPPRLRAGGHHAVGFEATTIRRTGEHLELDGRLTVNGRTLAVTVMGTLDDPPGSEELRLELETRIDRRQFGLSWDRPAPDDGSVLGTDVRLHAHLTMTRS